MAFPIWEIRGKDESGCTVHNTYLETKIFLLILALAFSCNISFDSEWCMTLVTLARVMLRVYSTLAITISHQFFISACKIGVSVFVFVFHDGIFFID